MKKTLISLAVLFSSTAFAGSALDACNVADVTPTAVACFSSASENDANGAKGKFTLATQSALSTNFFGGNWTLLGKSNDDGFGPFTGNPEVKIGTLTFDQPITGEFALTLKAGDGFSAYNIIGNSTTQVTFSLDKELSHASLWVTEGTVVGLPPVPEPGTYALMLAGLGAIGFVARRRSKA